MTTKTLHDGPDLLDLLGEHVEQAPAPARRRSRRTRADDERDQAEAAAGRRRDRWRRHFARVPWTWQHDGPDYVSGDVTLGYRCPDPECARVEPTAYLLRLNHGWDPERASISRPLDTRCGRVLRARAHRYHHEQHCQKDCGCAELEAADAARDAAAYWPAIGGRP